MFSIKKKKVEIPVYDLTYPFYEFVRADKKKHFDGDVLRWLDGYRNIHATGSVGSGKTTGISNALFSKFLEYDLGGCIRIVKAGEMERVLKLCKKAG